MAAIVIAIDFGTTGSGFAYAYAAKPNDVQMHNDWPGKGPPYVKTLTQLAYSPDGKQLLGWGWPALETYTAAVMSAPRPPPILGAPEEVLRAANRKHARGLPRLVKNFKMEIQRGRQVPGGGDRQFEDEIGREYSVRRLVADYLRELKDYLLGYLRRGRGTHLLPDSEIRWCLTVPAIWTEPEKRFMRQAAVDAGLIAGLDDDRLVIVLEPEAAAVACIRDKRIGLPEGESFMLVDAGGGTTDITVHRIEDGKLVEVVRGGGAACGGTDVDRGFYDYVKDLLGPGIFAQLVGTRPDVWQTMLRHWDNGKNAHGSNANPHYIDIPRALDQLVSKERPDFFDDLAGRQDGIDDQIRLGPKQMDAFFAPVLAGVNAAIEEQFARLAAARLPCHHLVLVGGFAESTALQASVKRTFGKRVRSVLVPERPGSTILVGAVHLGFDASVLRARRTRRTYGCDVGMPFEEGTDPERLRYMHKIHNVPYCNDRFSRIIGVNEEVPADGHVTSSFVTASPYQEAVSFVFYATTAKNARYISDPGLERLGFVSVRIARPKATQQRVEVHLFFGSSEIRVEAVDVASGTRTQATLAYDW